MTRTRCITFNPEARRALSQDTKMKMLTALFEDDQDLGKTEEQKLADMTQQGKRMFGEDFSLDGSDIIDPEGRSYEERFFSDFDNDFD